MKDNFVEGLYVKDGELINDRPNGMMGIEKAAAWVNGQETRKYSGDCRGYPQSSDARKIYGLVQFIV